MSANQLVYPTTFAETFVPLVPDEDLTEQGNDALQALADHGFVVATGVHRAQVAYLSQMSGQEHIREYCPSDPGRFGDDKLVEAWLQKRRLMVGIYAVEDTVRLSIDDIPSVEIGDVVNVAYGWQGPLKNKVIAGADVTTAYRVGTLGRELAYNRRHDKSDTFRLGLPLGEMVTAVALHQGVEPGELSLETYASNGANALYDQMRFETPAGIRPVEAVRPTLLEVGDTVIDPVTDDENTVYYDKERGSNVVKDWRLYKRYQG